MKHLHSYTTAEWRDLPLRDRLEILRRHYCTGPCGQDLQTGMTRHRTSETLNEAVRVLDGLEREYSV